LKAPLPPELLEDGLWRIPLRMRAEPPYVNVYLLRSTDGWLLIDTGPPGANSAGELGEAMDMCGVRPASLRHILLTHAHPDHSGQAERLRAESGAPVWFHPAEGELLSVVAQGADSMLPTLEAAGTPEPLREAIEAAHQRVLGYFPVLQADYELTENVSFETAMGPLRAMHTPGHSPGHCCLLAGATVFSGDHVLPDVLPHAGFLPGHDSLGEYLDTFPRLRALEIERVLPSHGLPFHSWRPWLDRAESTHRRRLARVRELHARGLSPHQMVETLWPRQLRPIDYQLALLRVLGYLRCLESRNMA
jgi:glyoxylase-like metal-dependent hydrolase (beta-lactamase superfamily II)